MDVAAVLVARRPPPTLQSPLRGGVWVAANALAPYDHRRAFTAVDGRLRLAQRLAVDWIRLGPDGREFHGDPKLNTDFYGYGAEVLAVADARVSSTKDGQPDNNGANDRSQRSPTLDTVLGNYVVLDLGNGHFATYAHLAPGSVRVRAGQSVRSGDVLGRLGNSGNSDAPHLHFQLTDGASPLGSEGISYELDSFTHIGFVQDFDALDRGAPWHPGSQTPNVRRRDFPVNNEVVTFPSS